MPTARVELRAEGSTLVLVSARGEVAPLRVKGVAWGGADAGVDCAPLGLDRHSSECAAVPSKALKHGSSHGSQARLLSLSAPCGCLLDLVRTDAHVVEH